MPYRPNRYQYYRQPESYRYEKYHYHRDYRNDDRYQYRYTQPYPYPESKKKISSKYDGPIPVRTRRAVLMLGMVTMLINAFLIGAPFWRSTLGWYGAARITNYWGFEGLFLSCIRQGYQALSQCYNLYPIMGAVDGEVGVRSGKDHNIYPLLTSFRALMIMSMIFSVAGVVCSALGMRCATIIREDSKQKRWVLLAGGASHLMAALFTGICVSWYAGEVIYEFSAFSYQTVRMKFTLGACLYVGWISMVISLICGCMMTCCICCKDNEEEEEEYNVNYKYRPSLAAVTTVPESQHTDLFEEEKKSNIYYQNSRRNSYHVTPRKDSKNHDTDYYRNDSRRHSYHGSRISHAHDLENYSSSRRSSKAESHHHSTSRRGSKQVQKTDYHHSSRRSSRKYSKPLVEEQQLISKEQVKAESSQTSGSSGHIPGTINGFV